MCGGSPNYADLDSPRTAVVWAALRAELGRPGQAAELTILDLGGGTGGFAVPLAQLGHSVTVVDPSPDALATAGRRAHAAGVSDRITLAQGDSDSVLDVFPAERADIVLCHSVLEWVDEPGLTVRVAAAALRPGGALSVLAANRSAAVLARAIGGHFADAERVLADPEGRWAEGDGTRRRFDREPLTALLTGAGLVVEQMHGVRVVVDLLPAAVAEDAAGSLPRLELALAGLPPYRDIATQLHLLARKTQAVGTPR